MRGKLACLVLFSTAIATIALYQPGSALAIPAERYKSTSLAVARFGEIDLSSFFPPSLKAEGNAQLWRSLQETKGSSDVYVQSNVWEPGGNTGWHSPPGDSLIIVTAGTVTDYEGHDPDCKAHVYKTGMGFVDLGGDHVHILRNEGDVVAKTIAIQLIPAAQPRRIDTANPGNCRF